jgi:hypothetical protein
MWNIYPNENCEVQEIKKCEAYVIRLQILRWQHNSNDTKIRQR